MPKIKTYNEEAETNCLSAPVKIALLGDFHITKSSKQILEEATDILNKKPADIICLIGDFIEDSSAQLITGK